MKILFLFRKSAGFTLIELLVVIAIIGILSTVTLVAISSYQNKANDVAVGASLAQVRQASAMVYVGMNSYEEICDVGTLNQSNKALKSIKTGVEKIIKPNTVVCYSDVRHYCVQAQLISGGYFCVDSTGFAKKIDGNYCKDRDGKRNCSQ